jgi:Icc-related predicted phosphoesterase
MRILAAADIHGKWPIYNWLLAAVREEHVRALVLAGDLLGCPDGFDTPEEAQKVEACLLTSLLGRAGVPVFYIMGNDDLVELDSSTEAVQSLHGQRVCCGKFAFVGYQYSLPFMGGPFEKPESQIESDLTQLTHLLDAQTVLVSHSPALGVLDPGFGTTQIGSRSLHDFLEANPFRAHIHGHSHAGFGRYGAHFNVASAGHARAMILDLETMQHRIISEEHQQGGYIL